MSEATLSLHTLRNLATLVAAADGRGRARWMSQSGRVIEAVPRGITRDGGDYLTMADDVRDGYLWLSGTWEQWIPVRDVLAMMDAGTIAFDVR